MIQRLLQENRYDPPYPNLGLLRNPKRHPTGGKIGEWSDCFVHPEGQRRLAGQIY